MAYNLDYTKTADLLAAYKQERPVSTFLKDRYFADGVNFATDEVLVEYKKGRNVLAPFVSPQINGKVMKRDGYSCKAFEPAMIQPKRVLSIDTLSRKGFGEAYYNQLTPAERAVAMTIDDLNELRQMIERRKEQMSAEVLQKNSLTMDFYTDNNDLKETKNIAFYEGINNPAIYRPQYKWNTANADILGDIKAMCVDLQKNGLPASEVLIGSEVGQVLINNEKIQKLLDNRRYELGKFEPEELYPEVTLLGELNCYGKKVRIIEYLGTYEDEAGQSKDFIDSKSAIVLAPGCGVTNYGAITQIDYGQSEFTTYVEKEVPLYEVKDQTRGVILKSAPLVQPKNLSPFRVAKVL